jgi:cytochrome b
MTEVACRKNVAERRHKNPDTRLVWDLPVRLTHWLLVLSVAGSYVTHRLGTDAFRYHRWCGYAALVLVALRCAWGFLGPRHARFRSFVRGPRTVLRYLVELARGRTAAFAGHNPAGGWMVLLLLALLLGQALTGLFANDKIADTGPLYGLVMSHTSDRLTRWHHRLFDALLIAVALHVIAVGAYLLARKTNLVMPMLTGRKPASAVGADEAIVSSRTGMWLFLLVVAGATLALIIEHAPDASLFAF